MSAQILQPGQSLKGKWTGQSFQVERLLGAGANGEVYLVKTHQGKAAMKVCARSADIALEWGILQGLANSPAGFPKPMLIDDDAQVTNRYFYVMEWVPGKSLDQMFHHASNETLVALLLRLLEALEALHKTQQAFCDIKPENVLVDERSLSVRFVDVGGVTPFGRSVRQFTPAADRAFWGFGTRVSEATYDIAGLALGFVCQAAKLPPQVAQQNVAQRQEWLAKALRKFPAAELAPVLQKMACGECKTTAVARQLVQTASQQMKSPGAYRPAASQQPRQRSQKHRRDWTEWLMWISLGSAATVTLAAWASFLGWGA